MSTNIDYFEMWYEDRYSILATMKRNMQADLSAGYSPTGGCITKQKKDIALYETDIRYCLNEMRALTHAQVQHYCYIDLIMRGAIEP